MQIGVVGNLGASGITTQDMGGSADILVSDAGSTITIDNPFLLARGSLSILNGGTVSAGAMRVGSFDRPVTKDMIGTILVSGAGSQLTTTQNNNTAFVVGSGTGTAIRNGTLTVADQAKVNAANGLGTINVAVAVGSSGTVNIGGESGKAATKAGTIEISTIQFGAGNGTLNFNHTDENYAFVPTLKGNGSVNQTGSDKTVFNTDHSDFTGKTAVSAGILAVNKKLGGTMTVAGGRLQGTARSALRLTKQAALSLRAMKRSAPSRLRALMKAKAVQLLFVLRLGMTLQKQICCLLKVIHPAIRMFV